MPVQDSQIVPVTVLGLVAQDSQDQWVSSLMLQAHRLHEAHPVWMGVQSMLLPSWYLFHDL